MDNIRYDFFQIEQHINDDFFLENKGLGNEVAYYVYHYDPTEELEVRQLLEDLKVKYSKGERRIEVVHIDLYEEMIAYIESRDLLNECYLMEKEEGFAYLHQSLSNLLRMDFKRNFFVDLMLAKTANLKNNYVVFISGIGKAYPIIRTHHLLNNLHLNFDEAPVIFFYPGEYTGQTFTLFNTINDDNYYRAFSFNDILKYKED